MKDDNKQVVTATRWIVEQAKQAMISEMKTSGNQRDWKPFPSKTDSRFEIAWNKIVCHENFFASIKIQLTVNDRMKNHDPMTPARIVKTCDDKKNCLQNCIPEKTKIADRNEITKEREVWTAKMYGIYC